MLQSEETGKQWLAKIMTSFGLAGLQPSDPPWLMLLSVGHDEKPNQEEILVEVADSAPIRQAAEELGEGTASPED